MLAWFASLTLLAAQTADRPSLIACKTIIGFGAPKRAGTSKSHGEPLGAEEIAGARAALNWPHEPFVIPDDILAAWRKAGFGIMLDDVVAAACALFVIAAWRFFQ